MFTAHCPHEQQNVLLNLRSIESMTKIPDGFAVSFICTCGHRGTTHMGQTKRTLRSANPVEGL